MIKINNYNHILIFFIAHSLYEFSNSLLQHTRFLYYKVIQINKYLNLCNTIIIFKKKFKYF